MTRTTITEILRDYGVDASAELCAKVQEYTRILLLWNQKLNLTSVTDQKEIVGRHFGESLFAATAIPLRPNRLVDVGSGAGFPGLALKLILPATEVTLIEANAKKVAFLKEVVRQLELRRVSVVRSRAEETELSNPIADCVTARAVGGIGVIQKWSLRALEAGGKLVLWLGAEDADKAGRALGWSWFEPIPIPHSVRRVLLVGSPRQSA